MGSQSFGGGGELFFFIFIIQCLIVAELDSFITSFFKPLAGVKVSHSDVEEGAKKKRR